MGVARQSLRRLPTRQQTAKKAIKHGSAYYVEINMVKDHLEQREYQYAGLIRDAAKRYGLSEDLILP